MINLDNLRTDGKSLTSLLLDGTGVSCNPAQVVIPIKENCVLIAYLPGWKG